MNVETVTMDPEAAKAAFLDYRAAVHARHNDEDAAIMNAYKQLAKGHPIIDLLDALRMTGVDEKGLPRLAIARAHCLTVWFSSAVDGFAFQEERWLRGNASRRRIEVPRGVLPINGYANAWAAMPIIPPALRPRDSLANYYILFEPVWRSAPHPDPILLKRVGGYTFAVLAQWDLTPVEMMVLRSTTSRKRWRLQRGI